jgi:hypothetical protein
MRFSKIFSGFLFLILGIMTNLSGQVACAYFNSAGNVFYYSGTVPTNGTVTWTQLTNPSSTVGIKALALSPDGKMLGVGTDSKVYYSAGITNGNNPNWVQSPNTSNVLGVAISGNNYICFNTAGNIYYFSGTFPASGQNAPWAQIQGQVTSLAINPAAGQLLGVGTTKVVWYSPIIPVTINTWVQSPTTANALGVAMSNSSYVYVNSSHNIYYTITPLVTSSWTQLSGQCTAISMSPGGQMLCVGNNNIIYYSAGVVANNANWVLLSGTANAVGVAISTAPTVAQTVAQVTAQVAAQTAAITKATTAATTAGTAFTFNPATMKPAQDTFNPLWTLNATNPAIKFKARTKREIEVVFSADPNGAGSVYKLALGRDNNSLTSLLGSTAVGTASYVAIPGCTDIQVGVIGGMLTNGSTVPGTNDGTKWNDYWVALLDNVFAFGQGTTVGNNVMGSWTITQPIPQPKYFGFGGWDYEVDYKDIQSIPNQPIPDVLTYAFQFDPNTMGQGKVTYNSNWASSNAGNIVVQFDAAAPNDIYVQFAPSINAAPANCVMLDIGGNNNTQTWATNGTFQANYGNKVPDAILPGMNSYWVKLAGNTLTYGKGATVGTGTIGTWTLPATVNTATLQYIAFGGYNQPVTYRNISIANNLSALKGTTLNIPKDWMAEPGSFERVSVGIKDGGTEAWALGENGRLFRYNPTAGSPYTMPSLETVNPWDREGLKSSIANDAIPYLVDVYVSSLGEMIAIRGDKKTAIKYDWTKKVWEPLPASNANTIQLEQIVIANDNIYAVAENGNLYFYNGKLWTAISQGVYVAVGTSTAKTVILIGVSNNGSAYELLNKSWSPLLPSSTKAPTNLVEVTIGNEKNIYGLSSDGLLWILNYTTKTWAPVLGSNGKQASGFGSISANSAGTIVALDGDGDNYIGGTTPSVTTGTTATTRVAAVKLGKAKAKTVKKTTAKKRKKKTETKAVEAKIAAEIKAKTSTAKVR